MNKEDYETELKKYQEYFKKSRNRAMTLDEITIYNAGHANGLRLGRNMIQKMIGKALK